MMHVQLQVLVPAEESECSLAREIYAAEGSDLDASG
jgi:quinolinate synthase